MKDKCEKYIQTNIKYRSMFDKFSERHIGVSNEKDLKAMLDVIGVKSVDELISQVIPAIHPAPANRSRCPPRG